MIILGRVDLGKLDGSHPCENCDKVAASFLVWDDDQTVSRPHAVCYTCRKRREIQAEQLSRERRRREADQERLIRELGGGF